jgi:uncharacterized protein YdhG (YjbR/CyaY superfamily)
MKAQPTAPRSVDEYIAGFPADVQERLQKVRTTIRRAAPGAEESISYRIPTFNLNGRYLIYFAALKKHIGVYPAPVGNADLKEALSPYASGKGTVRFPLDRPIPVGVLQKIVKFRMRENAAIAAAKEKKKKKKTKRT